MRAVLASRNANKLAELRRALPAWQIELSTAVELPPESGRSYADNARSKARHGLEHVEPGSWALGEDSGIEAAALDGAPGIASARWSDDGVARLLEELRGCADRRARYVCWLVALGPRGEEVAAEGTLEGRIADAPRGSEGFGYDPIFVPDDEERTVAELGDAWKSANSHRARAARLVANGIQALGPPPVER